MATWSGIRKKLENDYLADSLKGRVTYFTTSYSYAPDHVGRAAIRVDGKEVLKSDYFHKHLLQWQSYQEAEQKENDERIDTWMKSWDDAINKGGFDNHSFYRAFDEYDNQSIDVSLESPNLLVRTFAILDRRVGKRRLFKLADAWKQKPDWVKYFLRLRLEAEGITLRKPLEGDGT